MISAYVLNLNNEQSANGKNNKETSDREKAQLKIIENARA